MGLIIVRLPRQTGGKDKEKIKQDFHYLGADGEIKPDCISVGSLNRPEPSHINQANFKRLHTREFEKEGETTPGPVRWPDC